MIQDGNEYQIYFTRDQIRQAAGSLVRKGDAWVMQNADLTDEQCDAIAEEIAGLFEDEFYHNVRGVEV